MEKDFKCSRFGRELPLFGYRVMQSLQADENEFTTLFFAKSNIYYRIAMAVKKIHIGNMIRAELVRQGRTMTWFSEAIHSDRSNAYKMLKRESIDLAVLMNISELLHYDFLKECSAMLDFGPKNAEKELQSSSSIINVVHFAT
ncbi:MAG: hypothetical protein IKZ55_03815 [Bacteroidales bacterium]|nr:hypothetical protein [Bacteroidales bacterium]